MNPYKKVYRIYKIKFLYVAVCMKRALMAGSSLCDIRVFLSQSPNYYSRVWVGNNTEAYTESVGTKLMFLKQPKVGIFIVWRKSITSALTAFVNWGSGTGRCLVSNLFLQQQRPRYLFISQVRINWEFYVWNFKTI